MNFNDVPGNKFLNKHFEKQTNTKNDYKCVDNSDCMYNVNNQGCSSVNNSRLSANWDILDDTEIV